MASVRVKVRVFVKFRAGFVGHSYEKQKSRDLVLFYPAS